MAWSLFHSTKLLFFKFHRKCERRGKTQARRGFKVEDTYPKGSPLHGTGECRGEVARNLGFELFTASP